VTFSIGYTKRSNIDDRGDFLSASVSFPIPTSSIKSSNFEKNVFEKKSAIKNYENYKSLKTKEKSLLEAEQNRLKKELSILNKKTINFAKNSRAITSKSYGIGNSSYIELLQSELLLQKLLTRKIQIEKDIAMNTLNLKYLLGEKLDE